MAATNILCDKLKIEYLFKRFRQCLKRLFCSKSWENACSVILAHNHPSGDNEPSEDDVEVTKRIIEAGKIMGVDVLDHVIIAKGKSPYSFKENRLV